MDLDLLDRKILYELDKDASIPTTKLAKKLKRSKEVTAYRIKRLQDRGILLQCGAIVDASNLGYFTFRVYIRWQNITAEEKKDFIDFIGKNDNIWTIAQLHGAWDLAFFIGVESKGYIHHFHKIWDEIQLEYKDKIALSKIAIYSPIYNFNKTFMLDGKPEVIERVQGRGNIVPHDEKDWKIIYAYGEDVRQPITEVANRLGMTPETVRQRIKKMEEHNVIVGYKADYDLAKLDHQGYRVDFSLNSTARNKELFEYLKQHKYFYQINKSIGGADFETEIVVENLHHLLEILDEVVSDFSDVIKSYEYMGYTLFPKLSIVSD